jgi:phospholipid transport system substrate-binding protein
MFFNPVNPLIRATSCLGAVLLVATGVSAQAEAVAAPVVATSVVASQAGMAASAVVSTAPAKSPDALIKEVSSDVLDAVKADKSIKQGDVQKVVALVDTKVLPYVNFQRMTSSAVGRNWRQASPEQQKRLQEEFKTLLVRTYAGALAQVQDQTVEIKPMRGGATDKEVVVKTEIKGRGEPVQLDYRLEQSAAGGWKIYDMNVLGVWLVENYRGSFSQEINASGIDGLIAKLTAKNKAAAKST